jgi:putative DNA primase/helicase
MSAIDQNRCPQSIGITVRIRRNPHRYLGYGLTGDMREHAFVCGHGEGGNGKGVLAITISKLMGGYAATASMDLFTESRFDRHPTELARLRGARLVTASETEENRAWKEQLIKQLTGGDTITARFMRQDFFEYKPQFKLLIYGNHRPSLGDLGESMKRRVNLFPFDQKPKQKDLELEAKLMDNAAGILHWQIQGCLDWQKSGLIRPPSVINATADYFAEQDHVRRWIEDRCDVGNANWSCA